MYNQIADIISRRLGVPLEMISEESEFQRDLEADSLDIIEILDEAEALFSVHVPESDIDELTTVGKLCSYIESRL